MIEKSELENCYIFFKHFKFGSKKHSNEGRERLKKTYYFRFSYNLIKSTSIT